jgi:signal transduction histidine kinase
VVGIVRDLKSLSRVDEDSVHLVDVRSILDTAASMLRNEVRNRARLVKDYGETPPIVINEARLIQVALNLIQNAAHAIEIDNARDNVITLSTSTSESGELVIAVSDTGCGIPPEALDSIFRSFYTTKDLGVGTGLGLSICKRLVVAMGGRIEVESEVGRGSTFRVFFPASDGPPKK